MVGMSGLDCSSVALDMTNFAAFTGTGNGKAPIARRGKASSPSGSSKTARGLVPPDVHWTEHNIRVHVSTCVLALQIAHLMRLRARRSGLDLSVRELLGELAGIGETVLLYQAGRGRPRAHRMLTDTTPLQDKLTGIFGLARYAPRR